jgi:hypothetical protein
MAPVSTEQTQPEIIDSLSAAVARLRDSFTRTGDVTTPEFMKVSSARDDLNDIIRHMYEKCIYKDD